MLGVHFSFCGSWLLIRGHDFVNSEAQPGSQSAGRAASVRKGMDMLSALKRHPTLYNFVRHGIYGRLRSAQRHKVFSEIYKGNGWHDHESVSGPGSNTLATAHIRAALPELIRDLGITSLLDIPCGDYAWMKKVDLGVPYIGADLVPDLITRNRAAYPGVDFRVVDLLQDKLPEADAIFCRDCLVHLSLRDVEQAVANIRQSGTRFLMTTTFPDLRENQDTVTPYWRALNMALILGEPERLVRDFDDRQPNDKGKHVGVWRI